MKRVALNHNPFFHFLKEDFNSKRSAGFLAKTPAVNVLEDKDSFNIELAAPSYKKSDFKIEIDQNILTISTEKVELEKEKNSNYSLREFVYDSFSRSFTLPKHVNKEEISAIYEGGILTLSLPKVEQKRHKVEVA